MGAQERPVRRSSMHLLAVSCSVGSTYHATTRWRYDMYTALQRHSNYIACSADSNGMIATTVRYHMLCMVEMGEDALYIGGCELRSWDSISCCNAGRTYFGLDGEEKARLEPVGFGGLY